MTQFNIPNAPNSIKKGTPLSTLLDKEAITHLAKNLNLVDSEFKSRKFINDALKGIEPLGIKDRGVHIAQSMHRFLPECYSDALDIIMHSLTPPLEKTEDNGLAPMFYMPHNSFVAMYGVDPKYNGDIDPFDISMDAQHALTQRFTCEFSIRSFIEHDQKRTLAVLKKWMKDPNPHVRRLCSEGTRSRLPWATKLQSIALDPTPVLPILKRLKNDPDLYVRRSVANHIGDIAKDHKDLAFDLCEEWLEGASDELKWLIRHAVRNPFKKGEPRAIALRKAAK